DWSHCILLCVDWSQCILLCVDWSLAVSVLCYLSVPHNVLGTSEHRAEHSVCVCLCVCVCVCVCLWALMCVYLPVCVSVCLDVCFFFPSGVTVDTDEHWCSQINRLQQLIDRSEEPT